jgi:hypothetical protein
MYEKTAGKRLFAKLPFADRERVKRVLEVDEALPEEASAELYGPEPYEEPFVGEEPAETPPPPPPVVEQQQQPNGDPIVAQAGEERFDAGRYEGQTVADVHALGEVGRKYLEWAEGSWHAGRLKAAVTTWNANHNQQEGA